MSFLIFISCQRRRLKDTFFLMLKIKLWKENQIMIYGYGRVSTKGRQWQQCYSEPKEWFKGKVDGKVKTDAAVIN